MNSRKPILASLAPVTLVLCAAVAASFAHAEADSGANSGVLTINGELTAQSCTVSGNGQGTNFTVTLPKTSTANLAAAGSVAGSTGFNIALTDCTPNSGKVHTFWQPGVNTLSNGSLKNNGTAKNVEVQLQDFNGSGPGVIDASKADGAQNSRSVSIDSGAAHLQYAAQYISAEGGAAAGTVTTSVTYSMAYD
ncbi:fimbrial protein [Burkholderia cepacia]|uniref:fimbrial protein n=1 Tax=Burkholderia cepacia TaxID=292 RepID=UPI001296406A|nr:fimbrial protein [Burkholderia cepacia]QFS37619.1 Type-1 fimbrial protein, A [Burkholderia cepacia]